MTLNNLQIKIKDFKSIQDTDWISLDGKIEVIGRNYIDGGSNGSGKSSILEALYTSVSLCDVNEKSDEQKQLKKYFKDNKNPFEILVKFNVGNKNYQIKATPDGVKEGTAEAKKHLYTLITSFLMQGMANSLIKQEANDVKTVISSYFECDDIIDNIIKNSDLVRGQLERKLEDLIKDKTEYDTILSKDEGRLEIYQKDLERLENSKIEIQKKVGFATFVPYDENKYTKILSEIEKFESSIKTMDSEIMKLYEEKASLSSGVENKIKELKEEKTNIIETAKNLYIRTIGNKFVSYVKKVTKEYNDSQKREYDTKNKLAQEDKDNKIAELKSKIEELEKIESKTTYISDNQRKSILNRSSKYTEIISKKIEVKTVKDETQHLYKDLLTIVKSTESETKDKLEKELSAIKKCAVKKFQEIKIQVFTLKNKPKKKLPKYYIVYYWDFETNKKTITENTATMLDIDKLSNVLQEIESYQAPDTTDLDNKIIELENTDAVKKIKDIDFIISKKQQNKLESEEILNESRETEKQLHESKIKSELFEEENKKLLSIDNELTTTKKSIDDIVKNKNHYTEKISETTQQINRWEQFLSNIEKDTKLVKNSFRDYIIDLYNDRLEALIDFYSKKVFNLNSKLVVKIGSKIRQPSLNGIKFDFTSGGEKSKALFIFSLAHRDYLSKQRGFNNDYIFCDEVFDGMDDISRQQSIQFLTQGLVMENVLVISHLEDTTLPHYKKITVTKNESGTKIKQFFN